MWEWGRCGVGVGKVRYGSGEGVEWEWGRCGVGVGSPNISVC